MSAGDVQGVPERIWANGLGCYGAVDLGGVEYVRADALAKLIREAEARGRAEAYGKACVAVQIVISRNTPDDGGDADPCLIDQLEAVESLIKRTAAADERAATATRKEEG